MPAAATNPKVPAPKKRNRKRKRRAASTDSSSSESESEAESEAPPPAPLVKPKQSVESSDDSSSSSSSSSSSDSDSDSDVPSRTTATAVPQKHRPRSPSPPPVEIPSFIPPTEFSGPSEDELKTRFRKFYMSTVADGFREDLEEIRKEPNLGKTRLEMLVDSLAAGTEVFSSEEMEIVLDGGNRP